MINELFKKKKYKILYCLGDNVLAYSNCRFYILKDNEIEKSIHFKKLSVIKRTVTKFRFLERFLRLEPKCIEKIAENHFVVCFFRKFWLLNFENNDSFFLGSNRNGWSSPLNICSDGYNLYWGDYGQNFNCDSVNIYRLNQNLEIQIIYSFPPCSIRHIHNVIFDETLNSFWILTGDNEAGSGIYLADFNWHEVKPIRVGSQKFRAVVGFPYKHGLIYATDSVDKQNYIATLLPENNFQPRAITSINGSCIYGAEVKDYYIFSTTVEPKEGRGFINMFSYGLGNGIKSRDVHIIAVSKDNLRTKIIASYRKDCLPMKLFQYGSIQFPKGQSESNHLIFSPVACKKVDGKNIVIHL